MLSFLFLSLRDSSKHTHAYTRMHPKSISDWKPITFGLVVVSEDLFDVWCWLEKQAELIWWVSHFSWAGTEVLIYKNIWNVTQACSSGLWHSMTYCNLQTQTKLYTTVELCNIMLTSETTRITFPPIVQFIDATCIRQTLTEKSHELHVWVLDILDMWFHMQRMCFYFAIWLFSAWFSHFKLWSHYSHNHHHECIMITWHLCDLWNLCPTNTGYICFLFFFFFLQKMRLCGLIVLFNEDLTL